MEKQIVDIKSYEILDSRGFPTIKTSVFLSDGSVGTASVPSGASKGIFEAYELRDKDEERYFGKGVKCAIDNINNLILQEATKLKNPNLYDVDMMLKELDGTENKSRLGANSMLSVSMAFSKACAKFYGIPLYRYLGGYDKKFLPTPMMNILNGGVHASNNVDIQEFMIVPIKIEKFSEKLRCCSEIYHTLGKILKSSGYETSVGDEGGFAPNLSSDEEAIEIIIEAIIKSGYNINDVKLALDAASSQWNDDEVYYLSKRKKVFKKDEMIDYWEKLCKDYPIISLEDGMAEEDYEGWKVLTQKLGKSLNLVGDDLFVTNVDRLRKGAKDNIANSILIKPNQSGSLIDTLETIKEAKKLGYNVIISHRSGETVDTFIADLAVATNSPFIKSGAPCRGERVSKYNRLLKIEEDLNYMNINNNKFYY